MQTAIIADIHGNLSTLDTVLADAAAAGINHLMCLGDVAATGPEPCEVMERLREINCPIVMGNADEWLLKPEPATETDDNTRRFEAIDQWCLNQLQPTDLDFIRSFRPTIEIELGGGYSLIADHGSPRSNKESIHATLPDEDLAIALAEVLAGGHTHVQMIRRYQKSLIINPGSVGLPYEQNGDNVRDPLWAEYAIVEAEAGNFSVTLKRVSYDDKAVVEADHASGMPHADWWIEGWGGAV